MIKGGVVFLVALLVIPLSYSLSIKELISRYSFSASSAQVNITNFNDYMVDRNNDGINDTLILELSASNAAGSFIFAANLVDGSRIIVNETNLSLGSGSNKINLSFDSSLLSQNQFNYSIKVYNSSLGLKFRKDNLLTQQYSGYYQPFKIINLTDYPENKTLKIDLLLNSTINGTFESVIYLKHNNSVVFSINNFTINKSINNLTFAFDNETIKRTHYRGKFNLSSIKIGKKTIKANFTTNSYDFRDFAASSYMDYFGDEGIDKDNDGKYDFLRFNIHMSASTDNQYSMILNLYDLFGNIIETRNETKLLSSGNTIFSTDINGSRIYRNKLNGPFIIKSISLYEDNTLKDSIKDAHVTGKYNFNDFDAPELPDLTASLQVSDEHRYGISNASINFSFSNTGRKQAFGILTEIFDNKTFSKSNKTGLLAANSSIFYQMNFTDFSDFEISSFVDSNGAIEESNESNNAQKVIIKLNRKPVLNSVANITVNETEKIIINLSASDPNEDKLSYTINTSKFSNQSDVFYWNTTTMDSGIYLLKAIVSDGYLNDSVSFRIVVKDMPEIDSDNDGLNDTVDRVIGDSINSTTINSTISIDDSLNLGKIFNKTSKLKIYDGNKTVVEFDFDFLKYKLNLTNISMEKQAGNLTGSFLIRGLRMPAGTTKIVYIDRINNAVNGICIKDEEILSLAEISGSCSASNEFAVECDGTLQNSYTCTYNETLNKYKIQGLKHSGVMQYSYTKPSESSQNSGSQSSSSSSGGSGGGVACIPEWQCSEWSNCANGFRTRTCTDKAQCAFSSSKPEETANCSIAINTDKKQESKSVETKISNAKNNEKSIDESLGNSLSYITGKFLNAGKESARHSKTVIVLVVILIGLALIFNLKFRKAKHQYRQLR